MSKFFQIWYGYRTVEVEYRATVYMCVFNVWPQRQGSSTDPIRRGSETAIQSAFAPRHGGSSVDFDDGAIDQQQCINMDVYGSSKSPHLTWES